MGKKQWEVWGGEEGGGRDYGELLLMGYRSRMGSRFLLLTV
jgi:hypothetical protein